MTDLEKIQILLKGLKLQDSMPPILPHLRGLLAKAQNPPEHGGSADGSLSEEQWYALREIVGGLDLIENNLEKVL